MIKKYYLLLLGASLGACAGASHTVSPVDMSITASEALCVVNNNNLGNEVQGKINRAVIENGYETIPISDASIAAQSECGAYVIYGGQYESDGFSFLNEIRVTVYDLNHRSIGYAEGRVPNNINLKKYSAGDELIKTVIGELLPDR